jgi:hypothetical protein
MLTLTSSQLTEFHNRILNGNRAGAYLYLSG